MVVCVIWVAVLIVALEHNAAVDVRFRVSERSAAVAVCLQRALP